MKEKTTKSTWEQFRASISTGDEVVVYEIYRLIGYPFFAFAINSKLTGNHLTILSFLISLCGGILLLSSEYLWRLVAVILIQVGLGVDTVDGALARYKNQSSEFGSWLSIFFVTLKTNIIWSCATFSVYLSTNEPLILFFGLITICHLNVSYLLMRENQKYSFYSYKRGAVLLGKHRMGLENTLDLILLFFIVFDWMYKMLIFMSVAGFIPWLVLLIRGIQSQRKNSA